MTYTVHQAKTNLSRLLKEVEAGQEVIITRGKVPVAKLVALADARPGSRTGQTAPAHPEPLTDDELRELGLE
jgi:prevent-host-death family protein